MRLNIKTTNISLTPAISDYVEKKLGMVNKFMDLESDSVHIQVELAKTTNHHRTGDIFRAEMNVFKGDHTFRAVSEKDDLYAAIDIAKDELVREVKTAKEKRLSVIRKGAGRLKNLVKGLSSGRGMNKGRGNESE